LRVPSCPGSEAGRAYYTLPSTMERFTRSSNEESLPLYNLAVPGDRLAVPDELDVSKASSPGQLRTTSAQSRVRELPFMLLDAANAD
jgi:hypothetical protein